MHSNSDKNQGVKAEAPAMGSAFRASASNFADSIAYIDTMQRYRFANAEYRRLLTPTSGNIVGMRISDVLGADRYAVVRPHIEAAFKGIPCSDAHLTGFHNDGGTGGRFSLIPDINADGTVNGVFAIGGGIGVQEQIETALHRIRRDAEFAQEIEHPDQKASEIAHDFNNLLSVILTNLQLIKDHPADSSETRLALQAAFDAAETGASLTRGILDGRRRGETKSTIEVGPLIGRVATMLENVLDKAIDIRVAVAHDLWRICTDAVQFETALLNLAMNARDAMPGAGRLLVSAENVVQSKRDGQHQGSRRAGDYVRVTVADTGVGMPPDVLEHATEAFFTTKGVGRGTGLGLSCVHAYVQQSGGHMQIESAVGSGTRIELYFPRFREEIRPSERAIEPRSQELPKGMGQKILVVEDDSLVRETAARFLGHIGYSVIAVGEPGDAIKQLTEHTDISVMLSDVGLTKGMSGLDLGCRAIQIRPDLKMIFMSGNIDRVQLSCCPQGSLLLAKPFRNADLALSLSKLFSQIAQQSSTNTIAARNPNFPTLAQAIS